MKKWRESFYEIRMFITVLTKAKRIKLTSIQAICLEIHFGILVACTPGSQKFVSRIQVFTIKFLYTFMLSPRL